MEVLFYRDCRGYPKYSQANITAAGCTISKHEVAQNWDLAHMIKGYWDPELIIKHTHYFINSEFYNFSEIAKFLEGSNKWKNTYNLQLFIYLILK